MAQTRKKITISIKETTYERLKRDGMKISTTINNVLDKFFEEQDEQKK